MRIDQARDAHRGCRVNYASWSATLRLSHPGPFGCRRDALALSLGLRRDETRLLQYSQTGREAGGK